MRTCTYDAHVCVDARGVFFAARVGVVLELAARSVAFGHGVRGRARGNG